MSDYIKREDAISAFTPKRKRDWLVYPMSYAIDMLNSVPSADVAPVKHGKWEKVTDDDGWDGYRGFDLYICSECGNKEAWESPYCRKCGAKMEVDG